MILKEPNALYTASMISVTKMKSRTLAKILELRRAVRTNIIPTN